jgi:hypothetical protein
MFTHVGPSLGGVGWEEGTCNYGRGKKKMKKKRKKKWTETAGWTKDTIQA